ncbi:MAG: hypothetical protein Q7U64_02500 [Desulfocapsaceae bacterium]|nr:hypothetical protein [Desulfocapsaceae bacterium]
MAADFDQDHRLDAGGGADGAHEAAGFADAFNVEQDAFGGAVGQQVVEDLAEVHVGGGAQGDKGRESDVVALRPIEDRGAEGARLGDKGQVAALGAAFVEGGIEANGRPHQAQTVGADHPDSVLLGLFDYFLLQCQPGGP